MTQPIPTITDVLIQTSTANCQHSWPVEGGSITLSRAELFPALESAYDPTMPHAYTPARSKARPWNDGSESAMFHGWYISSDSIKDNGWDMMTA